VIYLHKILPLFVLPVGICLGLLALSRVLGRRAFAWGAAALLWGGSLPLTGALLMRATERGAERAPAEAAPSADAIVVLSSSRSVAPGAAAISEWADADRFYGGVELFKAGRAPLLIFTGGWVPWAPDAPPEGDVLREHAIDLGVPSHRILTTRKVVNTADEAAAVKSLEALRSPDARILLVTSAYHMPRARRLFERAGLAVSPFPVDFKSDRTTPLNAMDLVPTAAALATTEAALREIYGGLFYRIFD
jgi:uncharacterized SAM-binding protein YcdF (DUF218 family)